MPFIIMENKYKVVLVGASNVGKTAVLNSFAQKKFNPNPSNTFEAKPTTLKIDLQTSENQVALELWDLPGKEAMAALNRMYLRDANAAIIVYDVTDKESLAYAQT